MLIFVVYTLYSSINVNFCWIGTRLKTSENAYGVLLCFVFNYFYFFLYSGWIFFLKKGPWASPNPQDFCGLFGPDVTPQSPIAPSSPSPSPSPLKGAITRSMMKKIQMGLPIDGQKSNGLVTLFSWAKEINKTWKVHQRPID